MSDAHTHALIERIEDARHSGLSLNITAGSSKAFYGGPQNGQAIDAKELRGIVDYDPAELVIVARAGTALSDIQAALADKKQMLGFEPPFADRGATLGGTIASGLAGAGRPYRGGTRDYLLGTKLINGHGKLVQFGGRVMKNVAGFDLFRPMAGAMGTLGLLTEVSLRVIPIPEYEICLEFENTNPADDIRLLCNMGKYLPSLSASGKHEKTLKVRLSGSRLAVKRDRGLLEKMHPIKEADPSHWPGVACFEHNYFQNLAPNTILAAIDLPPSSHDPGLEGDQLIDWGGARRYLKTPLGIEAVRRTVETCGGSATLLQGGDRSDFFHPPSAGLMALHHRLKHAFDPKGIFNAGRLYTGI